MEIINLKNAIEIDFEQIINNKAKCDEYMNQIQEIIEKINIKYICLMNNIKENHNIEIPIYLGIDSLNFQNKLYTFKLFNIKKNYDRIFNRIYADYYKIHKLIRKYITLNTTIPSIDINITPYKDLDQDKYYNFEESIKIQNTISQYIQSLYDIITKKNITIQPFINSNRAGYAVNYYISEENTNIKIYTDKCLLFINYLTTFNKYHNNYLSDFLLQCRFLITSIKNDIDFNSDIELLNLDDLINYDISNNIIENSIEDSIENNCCIFDESYNCIYTVPSPLIDISMIHIVDQEISTKDISFNIDHEPVKYSTNTPEDNYSEMLQSLETTNKSTQNMTLVISEPNKNITALQKPNFCTIL